MEFDTIIIDSSTSEDALKRGRIGLGGDNTWSIAPETSFPVICLLRLDTLDHFRRLDVYFVDRGVKHPSVQLSRMLLDQDKVPLLETSYGTKGRLLAGVKSFLNVAKERGEDKPYVLGVDESVFAALWQQAAPPFLDNKTRHWFAKKPAKQTDPDEELMETMSLLPVPNELERTYVGNSRAAALIRQLILHAARIEGPILVLGDSGTGKEVIAQQIHAQSDRKGRFIAVNCGAIAGDIFESELFGHRKGSFTNAMNDRTGRWKAADNGTLFLDEIGDLTLAHQVKILRALDNNKVQPVGQNEEVAVNATVIAATNRDLRVMVEDGLFREDLYFRLRGFLIRARPLREHSEDIRPLARHRWHKITDLPASSLPDDIVDLLERYQWPGNVRELKMVLTNLHGLFRDVNNLSSKHLKAVFQLQGQRFPEMDIVTDELGASPDKLACLKHMNHIAEALRAIRYHIEPLTAKPNPDRIMAAAVAVQIGYREKELHMLLLESDLLCRPDVQKAVQHLSEVLHTFHTHLRRSDTDAALSYWRESGEAIYLSAQKIVRETVQKLKEGF